MINLEQIEVRSRPGVHRARSSAPFAFGSLVNGNKRFRRLCPTRTFRFQVNFWFCVSIRELYSRFSAKNLPCNFKTRFSQNKNCGFWNQISYGQKVAQIWNFASTLTMLGTFIWAWWKFKNLFLSIDNVLWIINEIAKFRILKFNALYLE